MGEVREEEQETHIAHKLMVSLRHSSLLLYHTYAHTHTHTHDMYPPALARPVAYLPK